MMRAFRRTTRFGCLLLAFVAAVQGLTPDSCNLASSWLLRQISPDTDGATVVLRPRADRPRLADQHEDGVPAGYARTGSAGSVIGWRDDDARLSLAAGLPACDVKPPAAWESRTRSPASGTDRDTDRLYSSLCRFRC
jgi:hypothetical protein